jgi:carbon starvation protein
MTLFILLALVYVIVAFADITAGSFASGPEELAGDATRFNPGGAVAAAAAGYLLLALLLGLVERLFKPPLWSTTLVFVPLLFALTFGATKVSHLLVLDARTWAFLIFAYCAVASLLPVQVLLQPRGYLGGIVLYAALGMAVLGLAFGDFAIHLPAFKGFDAGGAATMFPFLFVTIACGACSGFHGLVCSGTTSKQLDKETHAHPVGYGAMLAEGFVAVVALSALLVLEPAQTIGADGKPLPAGALYGRGMGEFLATLIGREHLEFAVTFGAMAFSTFVFDTLDVATRLGRYLVQELFGWKGALGALAGVALVVAVPATLHWFEDDGAFLRFWTLFGASNQLLAALTFICLAVWLKQEGRPAWFVLLPLAFILAITTWALCALLMSNLRAAEGFDARAANALVAGLLLALAATMVVAGWKAWRAAPRRAEA